MLFNAHILLELNYFRDGGTRRGERRLGSVRKLEIEKEDHQSMKLVLPYVCIADEMRVRNTPKVEGILKLNSHNELKNEGEREKEGKKTEEKGNEGKTKTKTKKMKKLRE